MEELINYKGYLINIDNDIDAQNPRTEWDNLGKMVCFHSRYVLGDKHDYTQESFINELTGLESDDYEDYSEYQKAVTFKLDELINDNDLIMLDLYLYDHSGITISCNPFSCQWDSGQVGFIYITREILKKEGLSDKTSEEIENYLKGEVETYDNYLTGSVYGYQIEDKKGNDTDSCWGFYGYNHEKSGLLEYAKNSIDCEIAANRKKKHDQIKLWIKNHVPLNYRFCESV